MQPIVDTHIGSCKILVKCCITHSTSIDDIDSIPQDNKKKWCPCLRRKIPKIPETDKARVSATNKKQQS